MSLITPLTQPPPAAVAEAPPAGQSAVCTHDRTSCFTCVSLSKSSVCLSSEHNTAWMGTILTFSQTPQSSQICPEGVVKSWNLPCNLRMTCQHPWFHSLCIIRQPRASQARTWIPTHYYSSHRGAAELTDTAAHLPPAYALPPVSTNSEAGRGLSHSEATFWITHTTSCSWFFKYIQYPRTVLTKPNPVLNQAKHSWDRSHCMRRGHTLRTWVGIEADIINVMLWLQGSKNLPLKE